MERNFKLNDHFVQRKEFVRENDSLRGLHICSTVPGWIRKEIRKKKSINQIMKGNKCLASGLVAFLLWECFLN